MTRINLLPWRETHRREKNNEFCIALGLCAAIAAGIGLGGFKYAEGNVKFQEKRNARLDHELALLEEELREIEELEETKNNLLARMDIIQELQGKRPQIVHTFYEVASRIPDGVHLTEMKQEGEKQLVIAGKAESNARVSALMRKMDESEYLTSPVLESIEAKEKDAISTFKFSVVQHLPKPESQRGADLEPEADDGV